MKKFVVVYTTIETSSVAALVRAKTYVLLWLNWDFIE